MGGREAMLDSASASAADIPAEDTSVKAATVDDAPAADTQTEDGSAPADWAAESDSESVDSALDPHRRLHRIALAVAVLAIGTLGTATAVLLNEHLQSNATMALEQRYLQAARQGVLDLTTISAATVDDDVARVLERSTGTFRDQFEERSDDFVAVAQQADVTATGSITEAGIESADGNAARVLVSATSSVTNSSGAQEEPRVWRLRITLENGGGSILMSDVEFVP
ncbi:MAG: hypothetical protein WBD41_05020 [Rhodococcus sp. (in: high G+C Gram-positive bacteria)]|jgi:Mce-associated membrane protein|uniref:hypothetical protein n=1 Tax=Rhodococcus sp. EPR-157 TaxID=1813677 RepID=UPI000AC93CCF|nr:hypothetical protein [Rhodococcus sp. EPR-157]